MCASRAKLSSDWMRHHHIMATLEATFIVAELVITQSTIVTLTLEKFCLLYFSVRCRIPEKISLKLGNCFNLSRRWESVSQS